MQTSKTQRIVSLMLALIIAGSAVGILVYYVAANKQQAAEEEQITDIQSLIDTETRYMENYQPQSSVSALQTIDLTTGTGDVVQSGATVTVNYTGALAATGVIFESSYDSGQPATFPLDGVIAGWTQGIPGMQVGGKRRLIIPASLAYGERASEKIPANSDLVFDVELVSIN
jgi:FKBP-type peptidyl-prolyl cis-trans isomerase